MKLLEEAATYYCVPCEAIFRRSPLLIIVDDPRYCITPSPLPSSYPTPSIIDDTFYDCSRSRNSTGLCAFRNVDGHLSFCSPDHDNCFCVKSIFDQCSTSAECVKGAACVSFGNNTDYSYCVSCGATTRRFPTPQFIDNLHYCDENIPSAIDFDNSLKYCGFEDSDYLCSNDCRQLMNDGSVSYSRVRTQPHFCLDYRNEECISSSHCSPGKACVKLLKAATKNYCAPCDAIFRRSPLPIFVDNLHNCTVPSQLPTPYPTPPIIDDAFNTCIDSSNCTGICALYKEDGDLGYCSSEDDDCFCFDSKISCSSSADCVKGFACVQLGNVTDHTYCVSCRTINRRSAKLKFIDNLHYCNGNTPQIIDFYEDFKYCKNGTPYMCRGPCVLLMNDGDLSSCFGAIDTQPCFCFANEFETCVSSLYCSSGEACVRLLEASSRNYCAPCEAIFLRSPLPIFVDDLHNCKRPSPLPSPYSPPSIIDDTLENCTNDFNCTGECRSIYDDGSLGSCSSNDGDCVCVDLGFIACSSSVGCVKGSACVHFGKDIDHAYCISCGALNGRSPAPQHIDNLHYCDGNTPEAVDLFETFKYCKSGAPNASCRGSCVQLMNDGSVANCSSEIQQCFCLNDRYDDCTLSSDCSSVEACVRLLKASSKNYCAPCHAIFRRSPLPIFVDNLHNCKPPSPFPTPYPTPPIIDDTFKRCNDTRDCIGTCASTTVFGDFRYCNPSSDNCFCIESLSICHTSSECAKGAACVSPTDNIHYAYCMSCDAINRHSPTPQFIDDLHYCDGNIPEAVDFDNTFKYCEYRASYGLCVDECRQLMNDGSVSYCYVDTQPCFCMESMAFDPEACSSSLDCSLGEACVKLLKTATKAYCALCDTIYRRSPLPIIVDNFHNCKPPSLLPTPNPAPPIIDVIDDTFESCTNNSNCRKTCASIDYGGLEYCSSSDDN